MPVEEEKGSYSVFDHTADIGLEVRAPSRASLYETAAAALFDVMFERSGSAGEWIELEVEVEAIDEEELLVRWLSELLFLYDTRGVVLEEFRISEISGTRLKAAIGGRAYDESAHRLKTEIKAITYHDLSIRRMGESWQARFVIDV